MALCTYIEESAEAVGIRDNWGLSLTVLFWSKVVTQIDFFRFREKENCETFWKVKIVETFALCTIKKFTLYVFFHSGVFIYYSKWPNTVSFHPTHFMSSTFGSLTHFCNKKIHITQDITFIFTTFEFNKKIFCYTKNWILCNFSFLPKALLVKSFNICFLYFPNHYVCNSFLLVTDM